MIPADHWRDNGDDTSWVVTSDPRNLLTGWVDGPIDRPCDTCDGLKQVRDYCSSEECDDPHCTLVTLHCPDCDGTGRHTFTIEVDTGEWSSVVQGMKTRTLRVSVIPGMALPIYDRLAKGLCIVERADGSFSLFRADGRNAPITLPPAAAPGMRAVKLAVAS
jgi:hypothetical protein